MMNSVHSKMIAALGCPYDQCMIGQGSDKLAHHCDVRLEQPRWRQGDPERGYAYVVLAHGRMTLLPLYRSSMQLQFYLSWTFDGLLIRSIHVSSIL